MDNTMPQNKIAIQSKRIITPLLDIKNGVVLIDGNKITAVGRNENIPVPADYKIIDVGEKIVAPGFIDLHNHGGMGKMVDEGGKNTVLMNSKRLAETGCTGWLPTVESLFGIQGIVSAMEEGVEGANVYGIHMEGPFLTPKDIKGIQGIDFGIEKPSLDKLHEFVEASKGFLKIMGVSVELEGADFIIKELRSLGIVPAIAHSTKASYEQFMRSVELGIRHVTHTYNVMTGLHQRKPGVLGGALTCGLVTNEIISDGFHVSPVAIDILLRCKGTDKVCVITDNTSVAGLPDGEYEMAGARMIKKNGVTRYFNSTDDLDHTMAGSEWPINHNVQTLIDKVNVSIPDAIKMASLNPAKVTGIDKFTGSIEPGKVADIIVVDNEMRVYLTFVKGKICHDPENMLGKN
jgi:N-acetylglucosamine-6-phosphate deacetylase